MAQQCGEPLDAGVPEAVVTAEPIVGALERPRIDAAVVDASTHCAFHKAGPLERLDVLRGGRERHAVRCGELGNGLLTSGEPAQHGAPGRVAKGSKDEVESVLLINHVVEYIFGSRFVNPLVECLRASLLQMTRIPKLVPLRTHSSHRC